MTERKGKYMPLWGRYVEIFDTLSSAQLGKLVHGMMHYYFDGEEPELSGKPLAYWGFLKQDLDNALCSYEKKMEASRKGGRRSAQIRKEWKEAAVGEGKVSQVDLSPVKDRQPITRTRTESITESRSESISKTETESDSDPAAAGICVSQRAYGEFGWVKLTDKQYRSLQERMGEQTLGECIHYIDQSAQSTQNRNRWKDWHLMIRRCYEEGWHEQRSRLSDGKKAIPQGASGQLGEAELEAIRRVLAE